MSILDLLGKRKDDIESAVSGMKPKAKAKAKKKIKAKAKVVAPKASAFVKDKVDLGSPSANPNETFAEYKKRTGA